MHGAGEEVYGRDAFQRKVPRRQVPWRHAQSSWDCRTRKRAAWGRLEAKKGLQSFCGSAGHALDKAGSTMILVGLKPSGKPL